MTAPRNEREISTSSIVAASKDQVSSDLAGETVLLSMQSAMYYGLDQVGSRIWELVREPIRVSDLRDAIMREYDVEPERCEADVLAFLRELAANGLIEVRIAT
jgi:coenzyme PQQ synthesis protein D (PqqD)